MKIYVLPIEPLNERYTDWWWAQIPDGFKSLGNEVKVIEGSKLTTHVNVGTVLDVFGTNYIKSTQIQQVCQLFQNGEVKNGDVFFVCDIWYPGVEAIRYMANLSKTKVKIFGVWHAGSITIEDFMEPEHQWAKYFELGYLNMCDGVFVGSDYSKESILERLLPYVVSEVEAREIADKIHAFGLPMNFVQLRSIIAEKKPRILFPSRFDIEKRPNVFMDMIEVILTNRLYPVDKNIEFMFCTGRSSIRSNEPWLIERYKFLKETVKNTYPNVSIDFKYDLSKQEYYTLLAESTCMVSCTVDETFGYCVAEACAVGTVPIVPRKFCYEEILANQDGSRGTEEYFYSNFDELISVVSRHLKLWEDDTQARKELEDRKESLFDFVSPYSGTIRMWDKAIKQT